jgi:hypothetical protein
MKLRHSRGQCSRAGDRARLEQPGLIFMTKSAHNTVGAISAYGALSDELCAILGAKAVGLW